MKKETILAEIKRLAALNGGVAPGRLSLEAALGIPESAWRGVFWVRWSDAIREADLEPNQLTAAYSTEYMLNALAKLAIEVGHVPTEAELKMKCRQEPGFPYGKTLRRLGTKPERIALLFDYCRSHAGFEQAASYCAQALAALPKIDEDAPESTDGDGFVYLIRSGRNYKIGRTNDLERRERELSYQTVEKNVKVHSIRTDDPSGIEAYWLRRFADKRLRPDGEWFALTAKDVSAFKRRKNFM